MGKSGKSEVVGVAGKWDEDKVAGGHMQKR